jgi:thiamine-phosphate pyrophosphorylase
VKSFIQKNLIYLITEGKVTVENFEEESRILLKTIEEAASIGITLLQIREKKLPAKFIFQLTREAVKIIKKFSKSNMKVLVNERADIAYAAKAHGVHLPENSIPVEVIRKVFPKDFIIGVSCHNLQSCFDSMKAGADFVTFSPIFSVPGKGEPKGLEMLREVCEKLRPFPVIALGGINEENYKEVLKIASGFASIRFLNNSENLRMLAKSIIFN